MKELLSKMVGSDVKRETVAQLQATLGLPPCRGGSQDVPLPIYTTARDGAAPTAAGIWPMNAAGPAIGVCLCCCAAMASRQGSTASTRCIEKYDLRCANVGLGAKQ